MTAQLGRPPLSAARPPLSRWSRVYGFGSVYAKTLHDSRLAFLIVAGMLGGMTLYIAAGVGSAFGTPEARQEMARLATDLPPILQGMAGKPIHVETLGGYMSFKYGLFFPIIVGLWSILALSGTLASEARRGSLEFLAAVPFGKRRLAIEKLAAHLTALTGAMVILTVAAWAGSAIFGTLPGDAIPFEAAVGFGLYVGLIALVSGSVAFALAPFLGRAGAAGIAGFVMLAGWLLSGYQAVVPAFTGPANLTWFSWTANHLPLAGQYDWASLLPVGVVAAVLLGVGVEAFSRRDLGATSSIRTPGLPRGVLGLHGPTGRSFGERLGLGLAWGVGLGIFGLVMAAASRSFADQLVTTSPDLVKLLRDAFPNFDITSAGGFLQFMFIGIGFIIVGFAAATLVAGWASDESSGRLEMLLATPQARARWAVRSGVGVDLVVAVMTIVLAVGVGIGAVMAGSDAVTPMVGSVVLGLYAAALVGIGFAIGGVFRTSIAAEIVALVVTVTFLVDVIAPALRPPDWVHQLALTAHMGQPMVGTWDVGGIVAALAIAIGGLAIGAWGFARRDLRG